MWFAYVDESFNDRFHYVSALLINDEVINETQAQLRALVTAAAKSWGVPADAELKGYDIFHGEGGFAAMHAVPRARVALYRNVLQTLADAGCWVVLRGVDKEGLSRRYVYPEHPHRVTMTHLIERVDSFCKSIHGGDFNALIVADEHHETQSVLLRDLVTYQDSGTWGYLAKKITKVVDTIHFVSSHTNALVQGADMVSFLTFRAKTHTETDARNESAIRTLVAVLDDRIYHQHCWYP